MKIRIPVFLFTIVFFIVFYSSAQEKIERQHRIKKSQFPKEALKTIAENSNGIKRLRFYREVDTTDETYTAKFKKSRLFYEMDFNQNGEFRGMAFKIKPVDIPDIRLQRMTNYLSQNFEKHKIRKMLQLYLVENKEAAQKTLKNAFQNLMIPNMHYKFLVRGKQSIGPTDYIVLFDAEGSFKKIRKSLPPNYDRVLY